MVTVNNTKLTPTTDGGCRMKWGDLYRDDFDDMSWCFARIRETSRAVVATCFESKICFVNSLERCKVSQGPTTKISYGVTE